MLIVAVQLLAELTDQFPFRPREPVVVCANHKDVLLAPAVTFDVLRGSALPFARCGQPPHVGVASLVRPVGLALAARSITTPIMDAGSALPLRPMLLEI